MEREPRWHCCKDEGAHSSYCHHHEIALLGHAAAADTLAHTCYFSFFKGEIVVNEVNFVRKCIATDTSQYDLWGKLICSNFKISFITDDPMPLQVCSVCMLFVSRLLTLKLS